MKWQETYNLSLNIQHEVGGSPIALVEEKEFQKATGKRLADKPYRFAPYENEVFKSILLTVKYRDRSPKVVARYIYQAIAEILWPTIPYWKHRWYGLVMAQPDEFPKGVKAPEGAQSRSRLLALTRVQVKRSNGGK